jgi:DNA-binding PadR family transcriptional regulator
LALTKECCGIDIMKKVDEISNYRISVGPGTLYALLDKFQKLDLIRETKVEGRKRSYLITEEGRIILEKEYQRLLTMANEGREILNP